MIAKIDEDLKQALKSQDKFKLSVLRMLKSDFINESRKGELHELTDDEAIKVIKRQVKTRKDSISEYEKYGKDDLVKDLQKEVEILSEYLPAEASEEDIKRVVDEAFNELNPTSMKDMGNVMKYVSSHLANANMSLVSQMVKDRFN